ncbi:MAG TPA: M14 family metallopeptidase, partial [candidate division Zixibacteria bacterium]|nr:M14 family metallopeptidase [candidate division Zixibacteria bacterium]
MTHQGLRQRAVLGATVALSLTLFTTAAATDPTETLARVTVTPAGKAQFLDVLRLGFDWLSFSDTALEFYADAEDLRRLAELGVSTQIEIPDVRQWYAERLAADLARLDSLGGLQGGPATMGGFETYSEIVAHLDLTSGLHSSIVTGKFSIGTTLEGNDIWAIKISDNPGFDEDEPEVLLTSLTHAREPMGAAVTLGVLDYLADNYGVLPWITDYVDTREIYIIPVVNPDGYLYNELIAPGGGGMWRKNRRDNGGSFGVDLNRNWGAHWGYDNFGSSPNPSSDTYRGTGAFSENETSALRDFILSRTFSVIHNHHSYGQLELWPAGYDRFFTVDEPAFQIIGSTAAALTTSTPQIGWELYPTNGEADDWAYAALGVVSMTAEIGAAFWPLPSEIPGLRDDFIQANLYLIDIADNPFKVGPPRAPMLLAPDSVTIDS